MDTIFFSLYYYYFSYVLLTKGPPLIHLIIFLTFCCHWGSQHHNKHANKELWNEAVTYGDIQILPFIDNYNLIVFKTVAVCMYAVSHFPPLNLDTLSLSTRSWDHLLKVLKLFAWFLFLFFLFFGGAIGQLSVLTTLSFYI